MFQRFVGTIQNKYLKQKKYKSIQQIKRMPFRMANIMANNILILDHRLLKVFPSSETPSENLTQMFPYIKSPVIVASRSNNVSVFYRYLNLYAGG